LRRQGLTCRDIAAVLAQKCKFPDFEKRDQQFCASTSEKAEEYSPPNFAPRGDTASGCSQTCDSAFRAGTE
jgi:hypothetical protein